MKIHVIGDISLPAVSQSLKLCKENGFEITGHTGCDIAIAPYLAYKLTAELELPKIGTLVFHPSLLPTRRGGSAIKWAYKFGDNITGVTWFWADKWLDGGDICSQEAFPINKNNSPREHYNSMVLPAMQRTLQTALDEFKIGYFRRVAQVNENATFEMNEKFTIQA